MAYQGIGTGTTPNDNTGDSLLTGALKVNSNFQEIYNALGDGSNINFNQTTTITAGSGLTGGGDLSANRTINVGAGDGISVSADSVTVDSTVVRTSGIQTIGGTKTFSGSINVDGTITNGAFNFILGNKDQFTRGDSGDSRALVKGDDATLVVNFGSDFTGGTRMDGPVTGSVFAAFKMSNGAVSYQKSKNIAAASVSNGVLTLTYANSDMVTNANELVYSGMARSSLYAAMYVVGPEGTINKEEDTGYDLKDEATFVIYGDTNGDNKIYPINVLSNVSKLSIVVHHIV